MKPSGYLLSPFLYGALMCPLSSVAMGKDDSIIHDASPSVHQLNFAGQQSCASSSNPLQEKTIPATISDSEGANNVDVSVELELLKKKCSCWKLNESQEIAAQKLFRKLKQRNITIKQTFYSLLAKTDQRDFSSVCHKVGVFFRYVNPSVIKDSGCLTSMVRYKKQLQDFISRDDKSIQYIAGLDTLCAFSSMHNGKGLPAEQAVRDLLFLDVWQVEGKFDHTLFHAFSSMQCGKGLPAKQAVKDLLDCGVWQLEGKFSSELFRAFSSMQSCKGLPAKQAVKDMLSWEVWQVDGKFSTEIFRIFSSMYNSKGLPAEQAVRNFLGWDVWQVKGKLSPKLLHAFSAMQTGRGLPAKQAVEDLLNWDVWQVDEKFNTALFRTFSSMHHGKGLPNKQSVRNLLGWDVWQVEGEFSLVLFRAFSSMHHNKGLPTKQAVKDLLDWSVWQIEGKFNPELFHAFSSMHSGRGLPTKQAVKDLLDLDVWQVDGKFSTELLRAFSSMHHGKGLPTKQAVKDLLDWSVWQIEGKFNPELFHAFSSMQNGKGLPTKQAVKDLLSCTFWQVDGKFSTELFRAFSSMQNGKGLPTKQAVEDLLYWNVWQVDGKFSSELLHAFSSMQNGKGLPGKQAVKDLLGWGVWQVDGKFSTELLRAFSSMQNGQGLPTKHAVEDLLDWNVWQVERKFSLELFRAFSSMQSRRGLPAKQTVKDLLGWLQHGAFLIDVNLKLMTRLYQGKGIPSIQVLKNSEQKLENLFQTNAVTEDDEYREDKKEEHCERIKYLALHLTVKDKGTALNWEKIRQFKQEVGGHDPLKKLFKILVAYKSKGVDVFLTMDEQKRAAFLTSCAIDISLQLVQKAFNEVPLSDWESYAFFSKNLPIMPDKNQWGMLSNQKEALKEVLKTKYTQRSYLEMIGRLNPSLWATYWDKQYAQSFTHFFPTVRVLNKLTENISAPEIQALLDQLNNAVINNNSEESNRLFNALLWVQLPLFNHDCFSKYFMSDIEDMDDGGLIIHFTSGVQTAQALALHFIAAVMEELSDMRYSYDGTTLKIEQYGGETHTFPKPELILNEHGLKIANWSKERLNHFFEITEFPKNYYLMEDQWIEHIYPAQPLYIQRHTCLYGNGNDIRTNENDTRTVNTPFKPTSMTILYGLFKGNLPIKSALWKSFDYHKEKLPKTMYPYLWAEIEKAADEVPESLKSYLASNGRLGEAVLGNAIGTFNFTYEEEFQLLWELLSHKEQLNSGELELLQDYQNCMQIQHAVAIMKALSVNISSDIMQVWDSFFKKKKVAYLCGDPLMLTQPNEITDYLWQGEP